jgi:hypothetical protein
MEFDRAGRNSIATQTLIPFVVAVSLLLITYRLCLRWFLSVFWPGLAGDSRCIHCDGQWKWIALRPVRLRALGP